MTLDEETERDRGRQRSQVTRPPGGRLDKSDAPLSYVLRARGPAGLTGNPAAPEPGPNSSILIGTWYRVGTHPHLGGSLQLQTASSFLGLCAPLQPRVNLCCWMPR